jgi:hypothetical protein
MLTSSGARNTGVRDCVCADKACVVASPATVSHRVWPHGGCSDAEEKLRHAVPAPVPIRVVAAGVFSGSQGLAGPVHWRLVRRRARHCSSQHCCGSERINLREAAPGPDCSLHEPCVDRR